MTVQKTIGAVLLCCGLLLGAAILWRSIREREAFRAEKGNFALLGIMEIFVASWKSNLRDLFVYALLILVLVIKPSGLMGKVVEDKA